MTAHVSTFDINGFTLHRPLCTPCDKDLAPGRAYLDTPEATAACQALVDNHNTTNH